MAVGLVGAFQHLVVRIGSCSFLSVLLTVWSFYSSSSFLIGHDYIPPERGLPLCE